MENITDENPFVKAVYDSSNAETDAVWILLSAFIIFTMQSGFGLLESGKCELNQMFLNFESETTDYFRVCLS